MEKSRLEQIERYIINFLRERGHTRILARELFDSTAAYANADMVRASKISRSTNDFWCATRRKVTTTYH